MLSQRNLQRKRRETQQKRPRPGHPRPTVVLLHTAQRFSPTEVLSIFDRAGGFLAPDQVRAQLHPSPDRRSAYSYLLRLSRQGLLERNQAGRGRLAYRLTDRGRQRLEYLREKSNKDPSA